MTVFFRSLCSSSWRSSIFSFKVWFSIFSCSDFSMTIRHNPKRTSTPVTPSKNDFDTQVDASQQPYRPKPKQDPAVKNRKQPSEMRFQPADRKAYFTDGTRFSGSLANGVRFLEVFPTRSEVPSAFLIALISFV